MAEISVITEAAKNKASNSLDEWHGQSQDERAKEALEPIRALSLILAPDIILDVDGGDVSKVLKALVERAELVLGLDLGSTY